MSFQIQTNIQIQATPEQVWAVLTDFESYPEWNPFISKLEGITKVGQRFRAHIANMTFKPKLLAFDPGKRFEWIGHLWIPGIFFGGKHRFELEQQYDRSTVLYHSETFTGILVPFLKKMLNNETKPGFEAMNMALKKRVEGHPQPKKIR